MFVKDPNELPQKASTFEYALHLTSFCPAEGIVRGSSGEQMLRQLHRDKVAQDLQHECLRMGWRGAFTIHIAASGTLSRVLRKLLVECGMTHIRQRGWQPGEIAGWRGTVGGRTLLLISELAANDNKVIGVYKRV